MVNSTPQLQQRQSKVIQMKPRALAPSREAVLFVQLFARAYRYTS